MREKSYLSPVMISSLIFATGVIVGALSLGVLSPDEKQELISYLGVFLGAAGKADLPALTILKMSLAQNLKTVALLWAFGMALVGMPLTGLLVLMRGFVFGFTTFFILRELPSGGAGLFFAGVLPHNLLGIPAFLLLSSLSMSFSTTLLRDRPWLHGGFFKMGLEYTWKLLLLSLILFSSSLMEAYVSPWLLTKVGPI